MMSDNLHGVDLLKRQQNQRRPSPGGNKAEIINIAISGGRRHFQYVKHPHMQFLSLPRGEEMFSRPTYVYVGLL